METAFRVTAWRDRDPEVNASVPGMLLGDVTVTAPVPAAYHLVAAGARLVRLAAPVELGDPGSVPSLLLLRELTRLGVAVDWALVLDPEHDGPVCDWRVLSHLYPPRRLRAGGSDGGSAVLAGWRKGFVPGLFVVRGGPGFVQFRDWRWGPLRVTTVDDAEAVGLVTALLGGTVAARRAPRSAARLGDLGLLQRSGDRWWMPAFRVRRWPVPAYLV